MPRGGRRRKAGRRKVPISLRRRVVSVSMTPDALRDIDNYASRNRVSRSAALDSLIKRTLHDDNQ